MIGLRGVGKTVLLDRMRQEAQKQGMFTLRMEVPEDRSLPGVLVPQLRYVLLQLSKRERAMQLGRRGLAVLAGFVSALKVKYEDIEVGLDLAEMTPERGIADNGDLSHDLAALLSVVGEAAQADQTVVVMFIDELQYVPEEQLAPLITALHAAAQQCAPIALVGAGLPQLRGLMGAAKSYVERLIEFVEVGPLSPADARRALEKPANDQGVEFSGDAIGAILLQTQGYPYFLQEWGKHVWDAAPMSPITLRDVEAGAASAIAALDASFFRVRFDRLTPSEKRYLRGMAELGSGPHRSGEIAAELTRPVNSLGPVRASLIKKGMIWSPSHGDTAFTVPLFDEFMKRIAPGDSWRED
jgi:hypothetical protein